MPQPQMSPHLCTENRNTISFASLDYDAGEVDHFKLLRQPRLSQAFTVNGDVFRPAKRGQVLETGNSQYRIDLAQPNNCAARFF